MLEIVPLPAFDDNYIWLLRSGHFAAVVDPGDADPVLNYISRHQLALTAILATHHHDDHIGGIEDLLRHFRVPVYGPRRDVITGLTDPVTEGATVSLPHFALELRVLEVPGHTADHVAYYGANALFCGDTLFSAGCGRLFEGTPLQMHQSLHKLTALGRATLVYCAHEYTAANLRFARTVEPDNPEIAEREKLVLARRARGEPTLPSTIDVELRTNPFLRTSEPAVIAAASRYAGHALPDPVAVFAALREWKNRFRG